jgi:hypothetical protein
MRSKSDKLLHSFEIDNINLHIFCLSEHHMVEQELLHLAMKLPVRFKFLLKRPAEGSSLYFVKTGQHFSKTDISHCCKEQDFEICYTVSNLNISPSYIKLV